MPSFSALSLGTRRDAKQFRKGAVEKLGLSPGVVLNTPKPSLADIVKLFRRTDDVIFLAGHFAGSLYNEEKSVDISFHADKVVIRYDAQTVVLNRLSEFKQTNCRLVIWGGCSVCDTKETVDVMRALFGRHVLIGWIGQTGWTITDIMFGGKGQASSSAEPVATFALPNYFDALGGAITNSDKLWQEWLKVAQGIAWGNDTSGKPYIDRFCAIDIDGGKHQASDAIS